MTRTLESVYFRYLTNRWVPTLSMSTASDRWSQILSLLISGIGNPNRVTVTYIVKNGDENISGGYVYFDYMQNVATGVRPAVVLTNNVTDGSSTATSWLVYFKSIIPGSNVVELHANVSKSGHTMLFSVEYDYASEIKSINSGILYSSKVTRDFLMASVSTRMYWASTDAGDIYNTNGGRVGIGTGSEVPSDAMLSVGGNLSLNGDIRIRNLDSDVVVIDSYSNLGYLFKIDNMTKGESLVYIDDAGQVGINTIPENMFHVVGNAQITDRMSVGAGSSPIAKLMVVGEGSTYSTRSLHIKNSEGVDLFRVHDDGTVYMKQIQAGVMSHKSLFFGNGLSGTPYNTEDEVTVQLANLIASPTGVIYTP